MLALALLLSVVLLTGAAVVLTDPHPATFSPALASASGEDLGGWLGAGVGLVVLVMRRRRPSQGSRQR
jgi:hypothetical protein